MMLERPIYHLEGIVRDPAGAEDFDGPLDLILSLLRKERVSIRDVSLTELLRQYLAWMAARRARDLEVTGEFITMASHLMWLKTRMLLTEEDAQAKAELDELAAQLAAREGRAQQARLQEVLPVWEERWRQGTAVFVKPPEARLVRRVWRYAHEGDELRRALLAARRRAPEARPKAERLCVLVRREPYRVERAAEDLLARLDEAGPQRLGALMAQCRSRSEATALFLALLELCRAGRISLTGEDDPEIARIS